MPLYEYKCDKCGSVEEVIQKVADKPLIKCSKCGGPLHKLLSSPAIQFKGTGWYVTDYGSKKDAPPTPDKTSKKSIPEKTKGDDKPTP
ncbi:MAG: zinc ribbon domain-containing protein, partial [Candidatus Aminicenantes bacterium]|nr:zinc ribbon domain-containing protein [Candidatus Aminicenantes bacterium]